MEVGHRYLARLRGDTVLMWCNTSMSSGVNWTHQAINGDHRYVYVNGHVASRSSIDTHYSIVNKSVGEFSSEIYNAYPVHSGRYECYESGGVRRFGYELNVTGM